jgi:hypothetical protein
MIYGIDICDLNHLFIWRSTWRDLRANPMVHVPFLSATNPHHLMLRYHICVGIS